MKIPLFAIVVGLTFNAAMTIRNNDASHPALRYESFIKDFGSVPEGDAQYSLGIFTDLPVSSDESRVMEWTHCYPGHTFIRLTKVSGQHCASKTIGLYPSMPLQTLVDHGKIPGKFSDDTGHPFDLSHIVPLTAQEFRHVLEKIKKKYDFLYYDIDDYNCTDFALDIYNSLRPCSPLPIKKDSLLFNKLIISTPRGMYDLLKKEKLL